MPGTRSAPPFPTCRLIQLSIGYFSPFFTYTPRDLLPGSTLQGSQAQGGLEVWVEGEVSGRMRSKSLVI